MGDVDKGKSIILSTLSRDPSRSDHLLKHIDYRGFNSLQVPSDRDTESRYDRLLARVGAAVATQPEFVTLLSFITMFSFLDLAVRQKKPVLHSRTRNGNPA